MKSKLTSRKFWICCAAFLASLGMGIAGMGLDNTYITIVGMVCSMLSACIYATIEAMLDYEKEYDEKGEQA